MSSLLKKMNCDDFDCNSYLNICLLAYCGQNEKGTRGAITEFKAIDLIRFHTVGTLFPQ